MLLRLIGENLVKELVHLLVVRELPAKSQARGARVGIVRLEVVMLTVVVVVVAIIVARASGGDGEAVAVGQLVALRWDRLLFDWIEWMSMQASLC